MRTLLLLAALTTPAVAQTDDPLPDGPPGIPVDGEEAVTTESGLVYSALARGAGGQKAALGDRVRVHYTGWHLDGTVFDSSVLRGVPAEFGMGAGLIDGWNEALSLMSPGDRFKLTLPPALAYGEEGSPDGSIAPGATLIFEVELIAVVATSLPYVPWPGEEAEGNSSTETGLAYRVLAPGEGLEAASAKLLVVEFAFWDDEGTILQSDALNGRPLLIDPTKIPLEFLEDLTPHLKQDSHVQFRLPTEQLSGLGFDDFEHVVGQVRIAAAMDWAKPEFVLPGDEELTTTDSGLKYKILSHGDQYRPHPQDTVVAHYAGWLTDGTQFDASYDRDNPLQAPLSRLIDGWKEGMRLVGRGGKLILVVPPDIGYGDQPQGDIPAGSTLVFVVELIEFVDPRRPR